MSGHAPNAEPWSATDMPTTTYTANARDICTLTPGLNVGSIVMDSNSCGTTTTIICMSCLKI